MEARQVAARGLRREQEVGLEPRILGGRRGVTNDQVLVGCRIKSNKVWVEVAPGQRVCQLWGEGQLSRSVRRLEKGH